MMHSPDCELPATAMAHRPTWFDESWPTNKTIRRGFSLVELVIVIIIVGIIAAIAVPRFSAATSNANDKQVQASLIALQNAVDLFQAEHTGANAWKQGLSGNPTSATVATALLKQTETSGPVGDDSGDEVGPYLRGLPANLNKGEAFVGIAVDGSCSAVNAVHGLGQTWSAGECGWNLSLTDLSVAPLP